MTLREQLIRDEGLRLFPYRDTVGKLTIGVGRNLDDRRITEAEAGFLLANDIAEVRRGVDLALPWTASLDEPRRAVLQNMVFNLGVVGLLRFHRMLRACESGAYAEAALEMLASKWAAQVGDRARRLAEQMETGEWV